MYLIEYKGKNTKKNIERNVTKMKKNRRKIKFFSSVVPLILFIIIGSVVGSKIVQNHNEDAPNANQNQEIQTNVIGENSIPKSENTVADGEQENSIKEESNKETEQIENSDEKEENAETDNSTNNNSKVTFDSSVAFIGDSRTQGFIMYNGLSKVQDYSYIGLMVDTAVSKKIVKTSNGEKITLLQDMKNKDIKSVYIMLGVNELGWSYPQVFKLKYGELVDEIKKVKPNCHIYLQSILPVTKSKDQSDKIFNNTNIAKFNQLVQEVAKEKNITYLDVRSALIDENGYLPEEASTDGIHINKKYCEKWLEYLKNNS